MGSRSWGDLGQLCTMRLLPILLICLLIVIASLSVEAKKKGKGKVGKGKTSKGKTSSGKTKPAKGKGKSKPAKGKGKKKPAKGKPSVTEKPEGKPATSKPKPKPAKGKKKPKPSKGKGKSKPKPSKAQKELDATFKEAKRLTERLTTLQNELEEADRQINATHASSRHLINDPAAGDELIVVDATLTGYQTKCGNQVIQSWTTQSGVNAWYKVSTAAADATLPFTTSSGTYTHPTGSKNAWLNICAFMRFRNTGNSNDVVILKSGSRVAAFGNADQTDWRSTGTCVIEYMTAGQTIQVKQESGGSDDCIEETGWYYSRLTVHTIANEV